MSVTSLNVLCLCCAEDVASAQQSGTPQRLQMSGSSKMWWKLLLLSLYLVLLFILSRILEAVAYYEGGYLASRLLDPVSLSVRRLKTLLDQRGVSYAGVVERHELTELVDASGELC